MSRHSKVGYLGIISFFLFIEVGYSQTEYLGTKFSIPINNPGVTVGAIDITNAGTITDLNVRINCDVTYSESSFLNYLTFSLLSPSGSSITLSSGLSGSSLYQTLFDDEASTVISSGSPPYLGSYQPQNSLSTFDGESIDGTWSLVIYNNSNYPGEVEWSVLIETDNSIPITSPNYGTEYMGAQFSVPINNPGVTVGAIDITNAGTITDLNVRINCDVTYSESSFLNYLTFSLLSPSGSSITLSSGLSGSSLYQTLFDDEASTGISSGSPPYLGPYQPQNNLSTFDGESITGTWSLLVNNTSNYPGIVNWSLLLNSPLTLPTVTISSTASSPTNTSPIPIIVTFSETVTGFEESDVAVGNGSLTSGSLSGSGSLYSLTVMPSGDGTVTVDIAENAVQSAVGYGNTAANQFSITYDGTAPNSPQNVTVTQDDSQLSLSWEANSESDLVKYNIYRSTTSGFAPSQNNKISEVTANTTTYVDQNLVNGTTYYYRISALDNAGNESGYSNEASATPTDLTPPSAPQNLSAIAGDGQVALVWRNNTESDVAKYRIYGGASANPTTQVDSTISVSDTTKIITSLTNGITYYYRITAVDNAGNESSYSNEVNATPVDMTPPNAVITGPVSGIQLEIGTTLVITWSAEDNVGITSVDLRYSVDNGDTWSNIATGEENDGEYSWVIPNTPSDEVGLQVIAYDAVSLSDTSEVMGLSIVIAYPTVVEISPPKEILSWRDKQITIAFSQQIDPNSITSDNIVFESGYSPDPNLSYSESTKTLSITTPTSFASLDTIMITLLASGITNIYGYQLDGDGDGTGGDDLTIEYTTAMLADYDTSRTIDVIDLAQFIQGWDEKDTFYELGPVTGTVPHFVSSLDSIFNIEDMMAFVMMWNWYVTNGGNQLHQWASAGNEVYVSTTADSILIQLPVGAVAYELQIGYQPETVGIASPETQGSVLLTHADEERGLFSLLSADVSNSHISLPIHITGKQSDITLSFRAVGRDGVVLSQFTRYFQLTTVPTEYALHQNYPNPFNPVTVIEYDLPEDSHVSLVIYDILGREVKRLQSMFQSAGFHKVKWDGTNEMGEKVGTGVYLYRIQTGKFSRVKKMILIR